MKNRIKKKAPTPPRICYICGKEIEGEEPEYIKTKRGTNIYIHAKCVLKGRLYGNAKNK